MTKGHPHANMWRQSAPMPRAISITARPLVFGHPQKLGRTADNIDRATGNRADKLLRRFSWQDDE
jgi:hypothetical protein